MRTVTTEDNPYKVVGDILFASSEVESDFRSVDLYGSSVRRKKEDAICSLHFLFHRKANIINCHFTLIN